jgi:hypothetical protein
MENPEEKQSSTLIPSFDSYSERFIHKLFELCFEYFNTHNDKDKYEEDVEDFIKNFSEYKPIEIKFNFKFLIEFIDRNASSDDKFLKENLRSMSKILL